VPDKLLDHPFVQSGARERALAEMRSPLLETGGTAQAGTACTVTGVAAGLSTAKEPY
jgi:hypothetical protein